MADTSIAAMHEVRVAEGPVRFRQHKAADVNLILKDWMRSLRSAPDFKAMGNDEYYAKMQALIAELVNEKSADSVNKRPQSYILVACDPENEDVVYGWACGVPADYQQRPDGTWFCARKPLMHYVYVRHGFRRFGIATKMLEFFGWQPGVGLHYTFSCKGAKDAELKFPRLIRKDAFFAWGFYA